MYDKYRPEQLLSTESISCRCRSTAPTPRPRNICRHVDKSQSNRHPTSFQHSPDLRLKCCQPQFTNPRPTSTEQHRPNPSVIKNPGQRDFGPKKPFVNIHSAYFIVLPISVQLGLTSVQHVHPPSSSQLTTDRPTPSQTVASTLSNLGPKEITWYNSNNCGHISEPRMSTIGG